MRTAGLFLIALFLAVILASPMAMGQDRPWSAEVGLSLGHNNNFFSRGTDKPRVSSDILNIYGAAELERRVGRGKVKAFLRGEALFAPDIDDGDHQRLDLGGQYKRGRNRFTAGFFTNPDRLSFFEQQQRAAFYDIQGYEINVRRDLGRGIWVRVAYESETWDWEEIENDRDADKESVGATVRFPLGERSGIRGSLFSETKDANSPDFNREGWGFAVRFDRRLHRNLRLAARYKRSERDYKDAPEEDRNFRREDTIEELRVRIRWSLGGTSLVQDEEPEGGGRRLGFKWWRTGERWGVQLFDSYRTGDSSRPDRNFSRNRIEAGVFFVF